MIVVKLIGGLGNQLFQYSIGRNISYINQVPLKLDISSFENVGLRRYNLNNFNVIEDFATLNDINQLKKNIKIFSNLYTEKYFNFNPNILKIKKKAYLDGYWQSEKYFKNIREILLNDFKLKSPLDDENIKFLDKIKNTNSISLHVRRGDYVSDSSINNVHGTCSLDYYKECIKYISTNVKKPCFFVFSDDYEWVKKNLLLEHNTIFAEHNNDDKNYIDLDLMSMCNHNIIANSSFSWWGAWINKNPEKIVCTPKNWFKTNSINTIDLIPDNWIKI